MNGLSSKSEKHKKEQSYDLLTVTQLVKRENVMIEKIQRKNPITSNILYWSCHPKRHA